jgi:hypothetical protein
MLSLRIWPPQSWSVFMIPIHTNNDCEGWHRRINHAAMKHQLSFYLLIQLLHKKAQNVNIQVALVSNKLLNPKEEISTAARQNF